ncbi:hypothetical protein [Longispora albida]|uniref:hypothetical protein n=1 Tax=Longispora albida TaxID=203523 RepID=UPI00036E9028|nr:hypothetical protein [Longispora albida]
MARAARKPPELVGKIFPVGHARRCGLTGAQLRGAGWQRIFRGVYADADLVIDHRHRCLAAAMLLPPGAAVTGRSAAWLYGAQLLADEAEVEVVTPPEYRFGPVAGLAIRTYPVPASEVDFREHGRIPVTTPERTGLELARDLPPADAVAYLDALAGLGVLDRQALERYAIRLAGRRGGRRLRLAAPLVDPRAESAQESRLRVRLILAGLPVPVPQFEIHTGREFLGRVDLAWPEYRVAAEYDALWHGDPRQLHADRRRLNRLAAAGWLVLHVTAQRMREDLAGLARELRAVLRSRRQY